MRSADAPSASHRAVENNDVVRSHSGKKANSKGKASRRRAKKRAGLSTLNNNAVGSPIVEPKKGPSAGESKRPFEIYVPDKPKATSRALPDYTDVNQNEQSAAAVIQRVWRARIRSMNQSKTPECMLASSPTSFDSVYLEQFSMKRGSSKNTHRKSGTMPVLVAETMRVAEIVGDEGQVA